MKKFISNSRGYIILSLMLIGVFALFLGLDWDQSQIPWRGKISWLPIALGAAMFLGGCAWLATATWGDNKRNP